MLLISLLVLFSPVRAPIVAIKPNYSGKTAFWIGCMNSELHYTLYPETTKGCYKIRNNTTPYEKEFQDADTWCKKQFLKVYREKL